MEKILRRSIVRRNQLLKQARKDDFKSLQKEWRDYRYQREHMQSEIAKNIAAERKRRREDWMLGPLATNHEAGVNKGIFGAVDPIFNQSPPIPTRMRKGPKGRGSDAYGSEDKNIYPDGEWRGEGMVGNVVVGDRVVVVKGREGVRGKIGVVSKVEHESNMVEISGVNTAEVKVPAYALSQREKVFPTDLPVPINDVRLIMHMEDPDTGFNEDMIVDHVYGGWPWQQRDPGSNIPRHTRYIGGTRMEIAWPEPEIEKPQATDVDTSRGDVEKVTYTPTMEYHPFYSSEQREVQDYSSVIDELRGKYSRDRMSHDDIDWMRRKVIEDARQDWLDSRSLIGSRQKKNIQPSPAERMQAQLVGREKMTADVTKTLKLVSQMQSINLKGKAKRWNAI